MFRAILLGVVALCASASTALAANLLADGGFEIQGGTVGSYCYGGFSAGGNDPCPTGAWTLAAGGGLQDENNGPWPGEPSPNGTKYAFIQNGGYIEQAFTLSAPGVVRFTWQDAGRPSGCCQGNQTYDVLLNNVVFASFATTTDQPFTSRGFAANLGAGVHTLRFQGTNLTGDNTSFLNDVGAVVPEPSSWALMIMGFGAAGAVLRQRRRLVLAG